MIRRGDKVKLIARKRPSKLTARRGVVERITANKANAVVLWDGRNCHRTLALPFNNSRRWGNFRAQYVTNAASANIFGLVRRCAFLGRHKC